MKVKSILIIVVIIVFILSLVGFTIFSFERNKLMVAEKSISQAVDLIKQGRYQDGIDICNNFSLEYYTTYFCHASNLGVKLGNNVSITKEFCDSYPREFKSNLHWILKLFRFFERPNEAGEYAYSVYEQRESCYSHIPKELSSISVRDGVAHGQGVVIRIGLENNINRLFEFTLLPARIQIFTETFPGSKQKEKLVYDKVHTLTESGQSITILKEELNYTIFDKSTSITVVLIEKPNGEVVVGETSNLPLYLVLESPNLNVSVN